MQEIFFQGWSGPGRILLVGVLSYAALVLILRATGKRTLSKLNAFDLVVTIALGSTLSSIILDDQIALIEGLTALALLAFLQFAVAFTTARLPFLRRYITAEPTLLLYEGRLRPDALKRSAWSRARCCRPCATRAAGPCRRPRRSSCRATAPWRWCWAAVLDAAP
ncbi:MAG: DUF421 domain-containing protein [Brevundimonas sp.]